MKVEMIPRLHPRRGGEVKVGNVYTNPHGRPFYKGDVPGLDRRSPRGLRWARLGGAALIFVFVIGVGVSAKAHVSMVRQYGPGWESHDATKAGYPHSLGPVEVAYVSNTEQPRFPLLDFDVLLRRENRPVGQSLQFPASPTFNFSIGEIEREFFYVRVERYGAILSDNHKSNPSIIKNGIGSPVIHVSDVRGDDSPIPNIARHPEMFHPNLGAMRGDELVLGSIDRVPKLNSLPAENDQLQKSDSRERARQLHKPPIGTAFAVTLSAVAVGYIGSLWGWNNFYNERRLFGAALIILSGLLGAFGFFFWWSLPL
jgi:hypothetical protein